MTLRSLLPLVLSLLFGSAALAAEPIFPAGSRIGLAPPPGMAAATSFQGFEDREKRVVLLISEVSAPSYEKNAQDFTAKRGWWWPARSRTARQSGNGRCSRAATT